MHLHLHTSWLTQTTFVNTHSVRHWTRHWGHNDDKNCGSIGSPQQAPLKIAGPHLLFSFCFHYMLLHPLWGFIFWFSFSSTVLFYYFPPLLACSCVEPVEEWSKYLQLIHKDISELPLSSVPANGILPLSPCHFLSWAAGSKQHSWLSVASSSLLLSNIPRCLQVLLSLYLPSSFFFLGSAFISSSSPHPHFFSIHTSFIFQWQWAFMPLFHFVCLTFCLVLWFLVFCQPDLKHDLSLDS
jgi:hypothetical protein